MKTMLTRTLGLMLLAGAATFATQAGAQDDTTLKPAAGARAAAQGEGAAGKGPSVSNAGNADAAQRSGENSASQYAPGQQKKAGDAESAAEAAPGRMQKSGEVDSASEAAPGQMKKGVSDETTASIDLSTEQRTEFRKVIVEADVEPVDVDFEVSLGATVPGTVTLHPLPPRIVEIVPAYESYQYFVLANGEIVIVEPATLEVVYVIRA